MKTATRALILASLASVACSSELGDGDSMAILEGATPGASSGTTTGDPSATEIPTGTAPGLTTPGSTEPTVTNTATAPTGTLPPVGEPAAGCAGVPITSQIPRLTNIQYDAAVRDIFKVNAPSGAAWSATFEPDSNGELPSSQWAQYRSTADKIAAAVMGTALGEELTAAAATEASLEDSVRSLGRKMFRRPLTEAEVTSYMRLASVEPAGEPAEIGEALVYALLISPSFLMRTELDSQEEVVSGGTTALKLSNYEVASRVSFLLWNSVPDEKLAEAADASELQTSAQIQAQAERMLGAEFKDKVTPVIAAAHRFYANISDSSSISRWGKTTHDTTRFAEYSDAQIAPSMAEIDNFFAEVGYGGQFRDLFLSNVAFVNRDTAPLYNLLPADFGPELKRVELQGTDRPGFLTRAAFLNSFAHERDTSPILRGVFILTLMGAQTEAPPPEALGRRLPDGEYKTNREAVTALTSVEPSCVSCHQAIINPPGFVLENFSAVGSIQTKDPEYGGDIDTAVDSVVFPSGPKPVKNALDLMTEMAAGRTTQEIYARKWVSYATGREANDIDQCTANRIADKIGAGDYSLANVLVDVTQADAFRLRVAGE